MNKELRSVLSDNNVDVDSIVLMGYMGSQSHGTYVPKEDWQDSIDDKDVMGVMIQDPKYYLGMGKREQIEIKQGVWDIVIYDFKKFVSLLCKNNPNVLGMLYLDEGFYIKKDVIGEEMIAMRDKFLSKQCYHSFSGYAHGQLHRMEHCAFEGYMGQKRKELVDRFGYDTKNAAHLIRLLKMGMEALVEHKLNVMRKDATTLIDIKKGRWTLDEVKEEAKKGFDLIEQAYVNSTLQPFVPMGEIEEWQIKVLLDRLTKSL